MTKTTAGARFGRRLRELRAVRKWTCVFLADTAGMDVKFCRALEGGTKEPCLGSMERLAKAFRISLSELLQGV